MQTEAQPTGGASLPTALSGLASEESSGRPLVGTVVYEALREAIVLSLFKPGEPLRQEALAEALGVSRVPVRSALFRLAADGLVELSDRKGAIVRTHTAAQVREIYGIRMVLEVHALRLSMRTMTPERVEALRALSDLAESRRSVEVDAQHAYYAELFDVTNNPELVRLLEKLRLKLGRYIFGWRRRQPHHGAHQDVLDAVAAGDVKAAVAVVETNLRQVRDGIVEMIEEEERSAASSALRSLTLRELLMGALDRGPRPSGSDVQTLTCATGEHPRKGNT
jgi:DNA-binding GntR family transcriptional regulator